MIIVRSTQFKKDFKKLRNDQQTVNLFQKAVLLLFNGSKLPIEYKEHPLTGDQKGITDIHLKPDLLLLYRIDLKKDELHLIRIGSHSTLFG
jgi:mRNA interferase YafQ